MVLPLLSAGRAIPMAAVTRLLMQLALLLPLASTAIILSAVSCVTGEWHRPLMCKLLVIREQLWYIDWATAMPRLIGQ